MAERDSKTGKFVKSEPKVEEQPTKRAVVKPKPTAAKPKAKVKKVITKKVVKPKVEPKAKAEIKIKVAPKPDYGKCTVCGLSLERLLYDSRAAVPEYVVACNNKNCNKYRFIVARK